MTNQVQSEGEKPSPARICCGRRTPPPGKASRLGWADRACMFATTSRRRVRPGLGESNVCDCAVMFGAGRARAKRSAQADPQASLAHQTGDLRFSDPLALPSVVSLN